MNRRPQKEVDRLRYTTAQDLAALAGLLEESCPAGLFYVMKLARRLAVMTHRCRGDWAKGRTFTFADGSIIQHESNCGWTIPEKTTMTRKRRARSTAAAIVLLAILNAALATFAGCAQAQQLGPPQEIISEVHMPEVYRSAQQLAAQSLAAMRSTGFEPVSTADPRSVQRFVVRTEADFATALKATSLGDVLIEVDGQVQLARPAYNPPGPGAVTILPASEGAALVSQVRHSGQLTEPPANGLEFNAAGKITLCGVRLEGFAGYGAAVKVHGGGGLLVYDCDFVDCATRFPLEGAVGELRSQVIASHGQRGPVSIINSRFRRCNISNQSLSHSLYFDSPDAVILGCTFDECGNPFGVSGGKVLIFGNRVTRPASCPQKAAADPAPAFIGVANRYTRLIVHGNRFSGLYRSPWVGNFPTPGHVIDRNDYRDVQLDPWQSGAWAVNYNIGYLPWPAWQQLGYDANSLAPAQLVETPN